MANYRAATFEDSTKKTYASHRNAYYAFCRDMNLPPVPASEKTLALYAAYLARRLKSSSVKQYLNIVRIMHLECGLANPAKDSWYLKTTLKGIERVNGACVVRKTPITPEMLLRIKERLDCHSVDDLVFWAACLVRFFHLFRKSNLFASTGSFDPNKQFVRTDFTLNANRSLTIKVWWLKTIQCRERELQVTLPVLHPHPLCPVTAVCRAMHQSPLQSASAPAFPITGAVFDRKLKASVRGESGQITSHSFRRKGVGGGG